uniref:Uncharacterized protein n=1 Tax=Strongyloides venezuelensis TaxID=75913 RepID=A0A0K0FFJ2_STRVS
MAYMVTSDMEMVMTKVNMLSSIYRLKPNSSEWIPNNPCRRPPNSGQHAQGTEQVSPGHLGNHGNRVSSVHNGAGNNMNGHHKGAQYRGGIMIMDRHIIILTKMIITIIMNIVTTLIIETTDIMIINIMIMKVTIVKMRAIRLKTIKIYSIIFLNL